MYLVDTDVLSEARKGARANAAVRAFFQEAERSRAPLFLSVITLGEVRCGIARVRRRGDTPQADLLERWLGVVLDQFGEHILPFDADCAQVWGQLRAARAENPLDKQIAATALVHDLTVLTHNVVHFQGAGVALLDPFQT